ncbi:MAG: efflux RND transporter periplasmic adaptor subunit [Proteobacteria bacterium]|nr:efflux RND transporter periplasmic adaptor subunit [Pseudomonadota bacterium]MBU1386768.1 efflux RND transporter periplasmic adaptor subunit [Pseudomonadota bacterium]MBU1544712.1 efflux RND transporter periplasmic adaptor subunit [Pseudomonadota bacterium]MBU2481869.1 efflux RND transporter periplasmic adaptor subunit [Pseudomonadota bacterium]
MKSKFDTSFFKQNRSFIIVFVLILFIAISLGLLISAKKASLIKQQSSQISDEKALTNVVTMEILPKMIQEKITLPGVARPWISLQVVSEVRGKIVNKRVTEGQQVEKNDILAVIDKEDYQNAYDSAHASWEAALSTQNRLKELVKKNFVTQSQLDDAIANGKTSRAALDTAALNLSRCEIRSPMKGLVDRIHVENGSFLNSGDPVCQILQIDKLKIEVGIPESDVDSVRRLSTFDITVDALNGKTYTGTYHYLYNTTDSMAHLYTLEIKVDNSDHLLLPDMFAKVEIIKQQDPKGLAVPVYSLIDHNSGVGVFVEKQGQAQFRLIEKGFQDGWNTQVSQGLSPGEKVVVVGHRIIEDGEKIHVTRTIRDMKELYQ